MKRSTFGLSKWVVVLDLETEAKTPAVKESLAAVLPTTELFYFLPVIHAPSREDDKNFMLEHKQSKPDSF